MAEKEKAYRRLPGKGLKKGSFFSLVGTRASLWWGKDHLLCLYKTAYAEDYRRFYYKDIQAIVTRKTARNKVWNILFGIFTMVFALWSFTVTDIWATIFWIIAGLFLLFLFINWLRGPTCICHLHTSVSKEELPSLNRIRNAMKVINRLRPLIEEVQGRLTSEEIKIKAAKISQNGTSGISPVSPVRKPGRGILSNREPIKYYNGNFHEVLFYLLLSGGLLESVDILLDHVAITLFSMLIGSGIAIFAIVALIKQHGSSMKAGLRSITWITLGYVCLTYIISYFIYMLTAFKNPSVMSNQWEMIKMFSALSPFDNSFLMGFYIFSIVYSFSVGIPGLILIRKMHYKENHREHRGTEKMFHSGAGQN